MAKLPPLVSPEALASWTGSDLGVVPGGAARALLLVEATSALIRDHTGQTFVVPDSDPPMLDPDRPEALESIALGVASRPWVNPEQAVQESIGPNSITWSSPDLYLTKNEKRRLAAAIGQRQQFGIGTIATSNADHVLSSSSDDWKWWE